MALSFRSQQGPRWDRRLALWGARLLRLSARDDLFVRLRFIVFFGTLVTLVVLGVAGKSELAWIILGLGVLAFALVVLFHARLLQRLDKTRAWIQTLHEEQARAQLNWARIRPLRYQAAEFEALLEGLDSKNAHDLDFDRAESPFRLIDRTASREGFRELLSRLLGAPSSNDEIRTRQARVRELARRRHFRWRFCFALERSRDQRFDLTSLEKLLKDSILRPGARRLSAICIFLSLVNWVLGLLFFVGHLPHGAGSVLGLSVLLYFALLNLGSRFFNEPFALALTVLASLKRISELLLLCEKTRGGPALSSLFESFRTGGPMPSRLLASLIRIADLLSVRGNPLLHLIVNLVVPWDFVLSLQLEARRTKLTAVYPAWRAAVTELELLVSLAGFSDLGPVLSFPQLLNDSEKHEQLVVRGLFHPLLGSTAVKNDLELSQDQRCALVTGSNMAGKSTFLRSLGVNLLLAQAGAAVSASEFRWTRCRVYTSLRGEDSLQDEVSSFYAEVRRLAAIWKAAQNQTPSEGRVFYLIDEVFRGTNNRERLIGARSLLTSLVQTRAVGVLTTHDLELTQLPERVHGIENFHFGEQITGDRLEFPYELRRGPSPATNALKIMSLEGLPVESLDPTAKPG